MSEADQLFLLSTRVKFIQRDIQALKFAEEILYRDEMLGTEDLQYARKVKENELFDALAALEQAKSLSY